MRFTEKSDPQHFLLIFLSRKFQHRHSIKFSRCGFALHKLGILTKARGGQGLKQQLKQIRILLVLSALLPTVRLPCLLWMVQLPLFSFRFNLFRQIKRVVRTLVKKLFHAADIQENARTQMKVVCAEKDLQ